MARRSAHNFPSRENVCVIKDLHPKGTGDATYDVPPNEDVLAIYDEPPKGTNDEVKDDDIPKSTGSSKIYEDVSTSDKDWTSYGDASKFTASSEIYDDVTSNDKDWTSYDDAFKFTGSSAIYDDVSTKDKGYIMHDDVSKRQACSGTYEHPHMRKNTVNQKMPPRASMRPLPDVPTQMTTPSANAPPPTVRISDANEETATYLEVLPALTPPETDHVYEEVGTLSRTDHQQQMAVSELIMTESSYVQDIQLLAMDIRSQLQKIPFVAVDELLSNTDEILRVSQAFLEDLKKSDCQEQDQLCLIGNLFVTYSQDMELVYRVYCADYKKALSLLDGYKKNADLYKEILAHVNTVLPTAVPDLSFLLVKPVQRITKYPLLLKKILENVPNFDRAYNILREATATMEEVNCRINEFKRNKEVATKYVKKEQLTLMDRVSRINTHSLTKKTARLSQMLKHEAGILQRVDDKEYDILVEKFQTLASRVTDLRENVASYLNNLEAYLTAKPHTRELQIPEPTIQLYRHMAEELHQQIFPECKRRIQELAYYPLCNLCEALQGPQHLIKKRSVKLLDYEQLQEKKAEMGSVSYEEEDTMNTYRAIHSMLMSELPRVNELAVQWLGKIISAFVVIQRDLSKHVLQASEAALSQLPHSQVPQNLFWKMVEDSFRRFDPQLSELCRNFELVMPGPSVQLILCPVPGFQQSLSPKSEKLVLSLVKKHGPDKIYQVTGNISGSKELDLTLQRGHIVALLQDMDTKGNKHRWLVDAGGSRGYVPCAKLQPYHLPQSQQQAKPTLLLPESGLEKRRHSYTIQETPSPQVYSARPVFQIVAGYAFTARSSQEVSMQPGQPVTVLEPHDKKGSTEWSLVEVNGQRGYVPSSFLVTVPIHQPGIWPGPGVS
ncbi:rho guanine nucleotide exchange factor 37 isoform X1 [Pleurodeles waltl]|uniref:rho guanine nucleotide exchange factor 37 isoform X1 n=1 Tax=Pleurodeles waltl TaxID=8319 RepID=UPI003709403C